MRKAEIKKSDFIETFKKANLDEKVVERLFKKFEKNISLWNSFIDISFLPSSMKKEYKDLIVVKTKQLGLKIG